MNNDPDEKEKEFDEEKFEQAVWRGMGIKPPEKPPAESEEDKFDEAMRRGARLPVEPKE